MDFKEEMIMFEESDSDNYFVYKSGEIPVLFTAPHTMIQHLETKIKLSEPFTKAIAFYMNKYVKAHCLVKIKDTGMDANVDNDDDFKKELLKVVKDNNIKLVIDLHGASEDREFDIEFGTLNNLSADYSTIKELEDAFKENGITNIVHNDPFKGGAITKSLFFEQDVDVIQLEINRHLRNIEEIDNMKMLCDSFINFINQYVNK